MPAGLRVALLTVVFCGVALARPVTVEETGTFGTPDPTYEGFAQRVAVDGDYAIATASHFIPDPGGDPAAAQHFLTAFVFQHNSNGWRTVRRLLQYLDKPAFPIPLGVAMRNGIAAVQTVNTDIWELTSTGWVHSAAQLTHEAPGPYLAIDSAHIINGDGAGPWNANIFEKDPLGTWRNTAHLLGKLRAGGSDDEFRGGPVDISGAWAIVHQADGDEDATPETFVYHNDGGTTGWFPTAYGSARAPAGVTQFGPGVALNWPDLMVSGDDSTGGFVFREIPAMGFHVATRFQALDSFMGSGHSSALAHDGDLLLQHAFSYDRGVNVVNVFLRRPDATYEHVAVLAAKHGESLGDSIAISGHRVLVGGNANGLVYHFELPAQFSAPARIQDTFARGNGVGWSPSAGSEFATVVHGPTRVFRQNGIAVEARAVLDASDFKAQAIEADVRPLQFGASGSGVGLTTRYQNPQNFFEATLRNTGRVELRRMASGTSRLLASAAFVATANRNYRMRLESIGTLHRVLIDGRVLLDVDSTGPTHGRAALITDRARAEFDNVVVSPTLGTTLYANDFEDRTGAWNFAGLGFWNLRVLGSVVLSQSSIADDARASIGVPAGDQIVQVRARLDTFATSSGTQQRWFGLMARRVDNKNFYYLSLRSSNTVSLRKLVGGIITTLGTASLSVTPGHWYQLRLDAVGDQLRAYVDGNLLLEATDASLPSGNSGPAMFRAAADFDDFLAYQP